MISTILAATAAAVLAGAPVYQVPSGPPSAPAAPKAATVAACEAYVYKGSTTDLCGAYPTAKDLDCKLLAKPVQLVTKGVDPWGLDRDGDGIGCDIKPSGSASASSSASASPSASASSSSSAAPSASGATTTEAHPDSGPQLPLTGPSGWWLFAVGSVLVMGGLAVFAAVRRRRVTFKP